MAVLIIFLALFIHLIRMATTTSHPFNVVFIIGYLSFVLFHVVQNIGMTIQLLPITGIPLPFISYGGSALWSLMAGVGILLSIYYHEKINSQNLVKSRHIKTASSNRGCGF